MALSVLFAVFVLFDVYASAIDLRASDYIAGYAASIDKKRNGDLAISCSVVGSKKMDSIGVSRIEIQWYNGSRWTVEEIYKSDDLSDLQDSNAASFWGEFTHTPEESGPYRALVTVYAKDKSGSDSRIVTTKSV